jgi:hypothetical protein
VDVGLWVFGPEEGDQSAVLLVGVGGIYCGCSIPDKLKFYDIDFRLAGAVIPCL